ncbi:hypothetical protein [Caulobacter hibisci]|uniref:Fibronectin type-III domain-containing protein n=1 Tax=Caulobacter hibisci TaxID=2035993 RepID=A0ABS0STW2_9CAUL|nr:hypothetical protein [Caulobacter hibisci]MBI1682395.1 hypothetical protein [Caulobacter hibisci]
MSESAGDFFEDLAVAAIELAVEVAVTVAIDAAVQSLTGRDESSPEASKTNVKQPRPVRRFLVGRTRVSGAYALRRAGKNVYLQVFAYPEGPLQSFGKAWLNEDEVTIDEDGRILALPDGRYESGRARVAERLGYEVQTAYPDLENVGWTEEHRGDGVPSNKLTCEHGKQEDARKQFPAGALTELTREAFGLAYDWRKDDTAGGSGAQRRFADDATAAEKDAAYATWDFTMNPVVWFVNVEWRRFGARWEKRFAPVLDLLTAAADVCDEPVLQRVGSSQVHGQANKGSNNVTLFSTAGLANGAEFTAGGQVLTVTSISGNKVYHTPNLDADLPDFAPVRWINAVAVYAPRYQVGFWWEAGVAKKQVREWLRLSMDGWFGVRRDGAYVIRAGSYEEPTVIFGEEEVIDYSLDHSPMPGDESNIYTLAFDDPVAGYTRTDTDAWRNEDAITSEGAENATDLVLKGVQHNSQIRRLAKAQMDRAYAPKVTLRTPLSSRRALGERYIGIRIEEEEDLNDAVMEVTEPPRIEFSTCSIVWTGRLATAARYAWNAGTEEGDGPVAGYTSTPEALEAPEITDLTPFYASTGTGGDGVRMRIEGAGPDRSDLTWFYRWRAVDSTSWTERQGTDTDPAAAVSMDTGEFLPAETDIEFQITYQTGGGTKAAWSETETVSTSTDQIAPGQPTDLAATGGSGSAMVSWRNPSSLNLDHLVLYRGTSTSFGSASPIGSPIVGGVGEVMGVTDTVAAGTYRYWIEAFNANGDGSGPVGPVTATVT